MVRDKVACIQATGATTLVCNDGGCTLNIQGACRRNGVDIQVKHIAEILDAAMQRAAGFSPRGLPVTENRSPVGAMPHQQGSAACGMARMESAAATLRPSSPAPPAKSDGGAA
jgi:hypothetical protein